MFEKRFLAYILYITLLEIREEARDKNNSRMYHLADLLHNIPFSLLEENSAKDEYNNFLKAVESLKIDNWLEIREKEFYSRFPEFRK